MALLHNNNSSISQQSHIRSLSWVNKLKKEAKTNFFGTDKIPSEDFVWHCSLKNPCLPVGRQGFLAFKATEPPSKIVFASYIIL